MFGTLLNGIMTTSYDNHEKTEKLAELKRKISNWYTYFSVNITTGRSDHEFLYQNQWDSFQISELQEQKKPILQFNKLYDYVKKAIAFFLQNTPEMSVISKDYSDTYDQNNLRNIQQATSIREGILRSIEYESKADMVYQTAFSNAISRGFGALEICTEYEKGNPFDQVIRLNPIPVGEQAFFDPSAVDITKSDGDYCGVYFTMNRKEFERKYGDLSIGYNNSSLPAPGNLIPYQILTTNKDDIVCARIYVKEWYKKTVYKLSNGQIIDAKDYKKEKKSIIDKLELSEENINEALKRLDSEIIAKAEIDDYDIYYYLISNDHIYDRQKWGNKLLPVIFFDGNSFPYEGQQRTQSLIKHARHSQTLLNYTGIEIAQAMRMSRKENFLITKEMIAGYEYIWRNPYIQQGGLIYNKQPDGDKPTPITSNSPVSNVLLQNYDRFTQDIREILGIYESSQGAPGQENSGIAIDNRVRQGNLAFYIYVDNAIKGIEQANRVCLDLIPVIYDTERAINIMSPNNTQQSVIVNQNANGNIENDLTKGNFDVIAKAKPPSEVQKLNDIKLLISLISDNPQLKQNLMPDIIKNTDLINKDDLVSKCELFVDPQVIAINEPEKAQQIQQQQQQMQQAQQNSPQAQLAQAELALKQQEIQAKMEKIQNDKFVSQTKSVLDLKGLQLKQQELESKGAIAHDKALAEVIKARESTIASQVEAAGKIAQAHVSNLSSIRKADKPNESMPL